MKTDELGKWHCGHGHDWMRPDNRGFDSFFGYLQGAEDHWNRLQVQRKDWFGVDFSSDGRPTNSTWGRYGTDLYSSRAAGLLEDLGQSRDPFYLYYSMQNVHYPLQAPEHYEVQFNWISDPDRRKYAAMISIMDEAVGDLIQMLKQNRLWDQSLIIVTADNGGETRDGGNNYPLRKRLFTDYPPIYQLIFGQGSRTSHSTLQDCQTYRTLCL